MYKRNFRKGSLHAWLLLTALINPVYAQMNMNPYFSMINYPIQKHSLMLMVLPDFQSARYGNDFFTGMLKVEYGLTQQWTISIMADGQKIAGQPIVFGGMRYSTFIHMFEDDRLMNLTIYSELKDLNGASLYKMEVAGFGSGDLTEPLTIARNRPVRTFEQRILFYHDWDRLNITFNMVRETALQEPFGNDYGYAMGIYFQSPWMNGAMAEIAGMEVPPMFSTRRLGYGLEMIGALGNDQHFGFDGNAQQHYLGVVLTYTISDTWSVRLQPAFGLSSDSDPFILRTGVTFLINSSNSESMDMDH